MATIMIMMGTIMPATAILRTGIAPADRSAAVHLRAIVAT